MMPETKKRPADLSVEPAFSPTGSIIQQAVVVVNGDTGEIESDGPRSTLGLSKSHIGPRPSLLRSAGARLFLLHNPSTIDILPGGGRRGAVQEFSAQSRKRLMQLFASIAETTWADRSCFVTLTYHLTWPSTPGECHSQRRAFIKGLLHRFPECAVIWRLEWQKRGAPHWHLLVVGVPFIDKDWITSTWARLAHGDSVYHGLMATEVAQVRTWYHACAYISKEVAKVRQSTAEGAWGRYWGVENRESLPVELYEVGLTPEEFGRLKEVVLGTVPAESINPWLRKGNRGCWTMLPCEESDMMLAWVRCTAPGQIEYRTYRAALRLLMDP